MPKPEERKSLRNADLPPGIVRTAAGHLRYSSPKSKRGKYLHRDRVEQLIEETDWYRRPLLPWPYEVHHADWNKEHNCPGNLIIVSEALHSAMTADGPRARHHNGKFRPKWLPPPEWALFDKDLGEVPF